MVGGLEAVRQRLPDRLTADDRGHGHVFGNSCDGAAHRVDGLLLEVGGGHRARAGGHRRRGPHWGLVDRGQDREARLVGAGDVDRFVECPVRMVGPVDADEDVAKHDLAPGSTIIFGMPNISMAAAVLSSGMSSNASIDFVTAFDALAQAVRRARGATAANGGLTLSQYGLLEGLTSRPAARVQELAGDAGIAPSTATRILDALERRGVVRRARSLEDRRAVAVSLTDLGRALLEDQHKWLQGTPAGVLRLASDGRAGAGARPAAAPGGADRGARLRAGRASPT